MKKRHRREENRRSTNYREAIEGLGTFSIDTPSCRGSIEIAIRKSLEARQIARYREGIKEVSR